MSKITEKELLNLKDSALKVRDQIIAAKSTMVEVEKNIANYEDELVQLGTSYEKSEQTISELEEKVQELYSSSKEIIDEYMKA